MHSRPTRSNVRFAFDVSADAIADAEYRGVRATLRCVRAYARAYGETIG